MTLQLLISTIDEGINRVSGMLLTPREGISYLVSWQHSDEPHDKTIPTTLQRDDITVIHLQGKGLSRNRNNCIKNATGDICMIADDDCTYTHEGLNCVAMAFATDRSIDIATFMSNDKGKAYPERKSDLALPHPNYHATSFEIAFRRSSVQGKLWFSELFGLGAPVLHCGEEEVFLHDALEMGLKCYFIPVKGVTHHGLTTSSTRVAQAGTLKARGAFLYINYPWTMIPRVFLISYRLHRDHGVPFFNAVRNMISGIFYIKRQRTTQQIPSSKQ